MKWRLQWTPEPRAALFEPLLEAPDRIMVVESFGCVPLMSEKDGAGYKRVGVGGWSLRLCNLFLHLDKLRLMFGTPGRTKTWELFYVSLRIRGGVLRCGQMVEMDCSCSCIASTGLANGIAFLPGGGNLSSVGCFVTYKTPSHFGQE